MYATYRKVQKTPVLTGFEPSPAKIPIQGSNIESPGDELEGTKLLLFTLWLSNFWNSKGGVYSRGKFKKGAY